MYSPLEETLQVVKVYNLQQDHVRSLLMFPMFFMKHFLLFNIYNVQIQSSWKGLLGKKSIFSLEATLQVVWVYH